MLGWSDIDLKAGILKMLRRTITSKLRSNGKVRHFRKEIDIIKDVVV